MRAWFCGLESMGFCFWDCGFVVLSLWFFAFAGVVDF